MVECPGTPSEVDFDPVGVWGFSARGDSKGVRRVYEIKSLAEKKVIIQRTKDLGDVMGDLWPAEGGFNATLQDSEGKVLGEISLRHQGGNPATMSSQFKPAGQGEWENANEARKEYSPDVWESGWCKDRKRTYHFNRFTKQSVWRMSEIPKPTTRPACSPQSQLPQQTPPVTHESSNWIEERPADAAPVAAPQSPDYWACIACTLSNDDADLACSACETPGPCRRLGCNDRQSGNSKYCSLDCVSCCEEVPQMMTALQHHSYEECCDAWFRFDGDQAAAITHLLETRGEQKPPPAASTVAAAASTAPSASTSRQHQGAPAPTEADGDLDAWLGGMAAACSEAGLLQTFSSCLRELGYEDLTFLQGLEDRDMKELQEALDGKMSASHLALLMGEVKKL